ncbi:2-Hacid_dh_11 domain-containing protein [Ktedonobacteria bacterium brp13]|nr:2-Hacid_dh_11 domain-containing protein [Ktedonobacteria bacterium brp13]
MKILFCREDFSKGLPWQGLAPYLENHEIVTCDREHILDHLHGVDILVPSWATIGRDIIENGSFGLIYQFGVGLEKVDIDAATQNGVYVTRIPAAGSGNAETVSEHAIFLMLALSRHFFQTQQIMQDALTTGKWGQPAGSGLYNKTACIVGLGDIGAAVARRLAPFGMRLTGIRQNPEKGAPKGTDFAAIYGTDKLEKGLAEADYVIISVNYGQHNHHMFNAEALASIKPGAFIINIARGGLIDHDALQAALASGKIAGAGLDVFWEEPVDFRHPIFQYNVIATPHIAGLTDSFYLNGARIFAENVNRYTRGQALHQIVNTPKNPRHPLTAE